MISKESWIKSISGIENDFSNLETNRERAKRELAKAIITSVRKRIAPKFGVLFSGGVDSTLIAYISAREKCSFTCYTVGWGNSDDMQWAKRISDRYGFRLVARQLSLDELEAVLKSAIKILGDTEIVRVSVGSVLYAAGKLALADGNNILFGGLGSEEIFAGYQRHEDTLGNNDFEALHKECWRGLKEMWKRDLTRDFAIASNLGLDLRTPFLDTDVIKYAMSVHPMHKLDKETKKIILRDAAQVIGLDKEFAWRKKQAAQYGSSFVDGIEKLAKRGGFEYKKDYLKNLYEKMQA